MIEQEWIDGVTGLLDEYVSLQENPLYWNQKDGFPLRARKIEIENSIGDKGARWLRALLYEREMLLMVIEDTNLLVQCLESGMSDDPFLIARKEYETRGAEQQAKIAEWQREQTA